MKRKNIRWISVATFILLFAVFTAAKAQQDGCDRQCLNELAQARSASAKYHDVNNALTDGFISSAVCVSSPAGAMGYHFANPARTRDLSLNIDEPELLLYLPDENGELALVAVEYFAPVIVNGVGPWFGSGAPPAGQFNTAPVLFGQTFDGPMAGHEPGMPWHYEKHVWIWQNNTSGMFASFNPALSCPS